MRRVFFDHVLCVGIFENDLVVVVVTVIIIIRQRQRARVTTGHPDVFDRMSAITMGGVSKACKGIHLSEDIFAGFNYVLRGGEATQADYIQACM